MWSDHIGRADDGGSGGAVQFGDGTLAGCLEAAVSLVGDLLRGRVGQLGQGSVLGKAASDRRPVGRRRGDEDMLAGAAVQRVSQGTDLAWQVSADVDGRGPPDRRAAREGGGPV